MPKVVDHRARRIQVADAVQKLVTEEGLDRVTVARTAATAGFSVGHVQHYFPTKDEMLLFTHERVVRKILDRVSALGERATRQQLPIRDVVVEGLGEWLPVDARRRSAHRVVLAFLGRTVDNPGLARSHAETGRLIRSMLATAVHNGKECGEVPADTDPDLAALELHSLTEGLALQLGSGADTDTDPGAAESQAALGLVTARVRAVFPGRCRQYG
ncbi:TetR family transcriptional regulator [Streptomyces longisporoflavus]|uniref:TetR/AcrR family transcriptional regulator n=1 Tax=Streptomyces longisporoflavus TaxID=28044 RepID=UPI00167F1AAA|nr:TetR/AcrR family transcriptional regulator [Streptomyces longisporoflavus]GGV67813.1 TetR family transcriptional regulator [Streptomyces longisporoflavus]